jgi:hypothetical protein
MRTARGQAVERLRGARQELVGKDKGEVEWRDVAADSALHDATLVGLDQYQRAA